MDGREKKRGKGKVYSSRIQAAPTPETSHGFRGSAGLKGITLSWSVWAWETWTLFLEDPAVMHPLHPRPTFCTSFMACVDPLFFHSLPKGRILMRGVVKISKRFLRRIKVWMVWI